MPTININSIKAGSVVYVNGIVDFSRIATRIEGEELNEDNRRRIANGMRTVDKAHTRLSISNAAIAYADATQPTLAEKFISEKLYTSKKSPQKGLCYTGFNKSKNMPEVYCRSNAASDTLEAVNLEGELSSGQSVTLVLRFFATKQNNGVSLDAVIVNNKPVKCGGNSMANTLETRGFKVVPATEGNVDDIRANLANTPAPAPFQANSVATLPQPTPAPYMQPAAVPGSSPAAPTTWSDAAASVAPAPIPVAPAAAPVAPQPAVNIPVANTAAPVPAVAAPAVAAPAAPSLPVPPKGYGYDENGRIVPIQNIQNGDASKGGITLP